MVSSIRAEKQRQEVLHRKTLSKIAENQGLKAVDLAGKKLKKIALLIMQTIEGGTTYNELPSILKENLEIAKAAMLTDFTAFERFSPKLQKRIQKRENRAHLEACLDIDRYVIHYYKAEDLSESYLEELEAKYEGTLNTYYAGTVEEQTKMFDEALDQRPCLFDFLANEARENRTPSP